MVSGVVSVVSVVSVLVSVVSGVASVVSVVPPAIFGRYRVTATEHRRGHRPTDSDIGHSHADIARPSPNIAQLVPDIGGIGIVHVLIVRIVEAVILLDVCS